MTLSSQVKTIIDQANAWYRGVADETVKTLENLEEANRIMAAQRSQITALAQSLDSIRYEYDRVKRENERLKGEVMRTGEED